MAVNVTVKRTVQSHACHRGVRPFFLDSKFKLTAPSLVKAEAKKQ